MIVTETKNYKMTIIQSSGMPPSKVIENPITWDMVREIVLRNDLERFARSRVSTEKYISFKQDLVTRGNTVFKHLLSKQLMWYKEEDNNGLTWEEVLKSGVPDNEIVIKPKGTRLFECSEDIVILPNHFPYYFEEDVVHLCVWTKVKIFSDPSSPNGDISSATKSIIQTYVQKTFQVPLQIPDDRICWFRNWESLQSVKSISHVHVIIKGVPKEQIEELYYTSGTLI